MVAEKKAQEASGSGQGSNKRKRSARPPEAHVAGALRTAYEETVRESVPPEFLDLLGKLS